MCTTVVIKKKKGRGEKEPFPLFPDPEETKKNLQTPEIIQIFTFPQKS